MGVLDSRSQQRRFVRSFPLLHVDLNLQFTLTRVHGEKDTTVLPTNTCSKFEYWYDESLGLDYVYRSASLVKTRRVSAPFAL